MPRIRKFISIREGVNDDYCYLYTEDGGSDGIIYIEKSKSLREAVGKIKKEHKISKKLKDKPRPTWYDSNWFEYFGKKQK